MPINVCYYIIINIIIIITSSTLVSHEFSFLNHNIDDTDAATVLVDSLARSFARSLEMLIARWLFHN